MSCLLARVFCCQFAVWRDDAQGSILRLANERLRITTSSESMRRGRGNKRKAKLIVTLIRIQHIDRSGSLATKADILHSYMPLRVAGKSIT